MDKIERFLGMWAASPGEIEASIRQELVEQGIAGILADMRKMALLMTDPERRALALEVTRDPRLEQRVRELVEAQVK